MINKRKRMAPVFIKKLDLIKVKVNKNKKNKKKKKKNKKVQKNGIF